MATECATAYPVHRMSSLNNWCWPETRRTPAWPVRHRRRDPPWQLLWPSTPPPSPTVRPSVTDSEARTVEITASDDDSRCPAVCMQPLQLDSTIFILLYKHSLPDAPRVPAPRKWAWSHQTYRSSLYINIAHRSNRFVQRFRELSMYFCFYWPRLKTFATFSLVSGSQCDIRIRLLV